MKNRLFLVIIILSLKFPLYTYSIADQTLISIHGFLGAPWNMWFLTKPYKDDGIDVVNWGYPSQDKFIEEHASDLIEELKKISFKKPGIPINFITHSMGGLVLRAAINHPECPMEATIGRAVLLAPPNQGACWGRFLEQFSIPRLIGKDYSGKQLLTENNFEHLGQFPNSMLVMVIAGNLSFNPFIDGPNDGTVAVEETFLTTQHCHKIVNAGHKSILISKEVAALAHEFFTTD